MNPIRFTLRSTWVRLGLLGAVALTPPAYALPILQLDVSPGVYEAATASTVATSDEFTLYALLNKNTLNPLQTYYISVALTPKQGKQTPAPDFGSFVFNGVTVNAAEDMTWGQPALMPPHSAYPSYYSEFAFSFSTLNRFFNYNVQDVTGTHTGPTPHSAGTSYFMPFEVDVSNLAADITLVFDLYTRNANANGKVRFIKAPFSHNAEGGGGNNVPDGGSTFALLGSAFAVLGWLARRKA